MTTRGRIAIAAGTVVTGAAVALAIGIWAPAGRAAAGDPLRGVWTAERSNWRVENGGTATLVQLTLRQTRQHGDSNHSHTVAIEELSGLSAAQIEAASSDVRFEWKRDAGSFAFEGRFQAGAGAGHYAFSPSREYAAEMRRRGYGAIDDEKALDLAIFDVGTGFIDELAALGYREVPLDKLGALRIHGVKPEFIRALAGLGHRGLPLDKLIAFRIHGVSTEFVAALRDLGYETLNPDQLVAFRIHGVTPEFVKQLKALGYQTLNPDQLVAFRIHGVTPEFVKQIKTLGYEPRPDDLVSLRIHGVSADFIQQVQGRRGKTVTLDTLVSMRIHGQQPE